jgi:DNA-binding Lrp family transcriptional regulator
LTEILRLLERDGKLTPKQIAAMLGEEEKTVADHITKYENEGVILKYTAVVDWDKAGDESVTALIEVKISPQRGDGFERIAERIYRYDEVDSLYLMSGAFDLAVFMTAKSLKDIAQFVFARLSPIDGVTGTATHFILKKYKDRNCLFTLDPEQEERVEFV